jgi:hypothetical protein
MQTVLLFTWHLPFLEEGAIMDFERKNAKLSVEEEDSPLTN